MPRRIEPHDFIAYEFKRLETLVRNLLVENKNLKPQEGRQAYYLAQYPQTASYVAGPLREQADAILERIGEVRDLAVEYANIANFDESEIAAEIARRAPESLPALPKPQQGAEPGSLKAALKDEVRGPADSGGAIAAVDAVRREALSEALAAPTVERPRVRATPIAAVEAPAGAVSDDGTAEPHAGDRLQLEDGSTVFIRRSANGGDGLRLEVAGGEADPYEIRPETVREITYRSFKSLPLPYGAWTKIAGGEHAGREGSVYGYEVSVEGEGQARRPVLRVLVELNDPKGGTEIEVVETDHIGRRAAAE